MKTYFEYMFHYACLGYDVSLTNIYGKDAIRMVKRYSYPAQRSLSCVQIQEHENLKDLDRLHDVLSYMYNNIEEQEKTENYYNED